MRALGLALASAAAALASAPAAVVPHVAAPDATLAPEQLRLAFSADPTEMVVYFVTSNKTDDSCASAPPVLRAQARARVLVVCEQALRILETCPPEHPCPRTPTPTHTHTPASHLTLADSGAAQFGPSPAALKYSAPASNANYSAFDIRSPSLHVAVLTGLSTSTLYYYRVGADAGGWSPVFTFTTAPARGERAYPVTFLAYGDMGISNSQATANLTARLLREGAAQFTLHAGACAGCGGPASEPAPARVGARSPPLTRSLPAADPSPAPRR